MAKKKSGNKWIQKALPKSSKGKLHKKLGVPKDKKIPMSKIKKAENSDSPLLRKEANLAETLKGLRKKK
jgi:hypothetical protein